MSKKLHKSRKSWQLIGAYDHLMFHLMTALSLCSLTEIRSSRCNLTTVLCLRALKTNPNPQRRLRFLKYLKYSVLALADLKQALVHARAQDEVWNGASALLLRMGRAGTPAWAGCGTELLQHSPQTPEPAIHSPWQSLQGFPRVPGSCCSGSRSGKAEERAGVGEVAAVTSCHSHPQRWQRCLGSPALRGSRAGTAHPESQRLSQTPAHPRIRVPVTPDLGVIPGEAVPRGAGLGNPCGSFHAAGITLGHSLSCALVLP